MNESEKVGMYRAAFALELGSNFTDPTTPAQWEFADKIGARALSELRSARKQGKPYTKESYFKKEREEK